MIEAEDIRFQLVPIRRTSDRDVARATEHSEPPDHDEGTIGDDLDDREVAVLNEGRGARSGVQCDACEEETPRGRSYSREVMRLHRLVADG